MIVHIFSVTGNPAFDYKQFALDKNVPLPQVLEGGSIPFVFCLHTSIPTIDFCKEHGFEKVGRCCRIFVPKEQYTSDYQLTQCFETGKYTLISRISN